MEKRENDLFATIIANPNTTFNGLVANGLTAENTSLQDKSVYLNSEWVKSHVVDDKGLFDLKKFDTLYEATKLLYQALAKTNYKLAVLANAVYDKNDIFVSPAQRGKLGPGFKEVQEFNPEHSLESVVRLGARTTPLKSVSELAQSNKVLLNPVEASKDWSKAKWGQSSEGLLNGFFPYFFDTLVLAQWDEDGTHKDLDGNDVAHSKGDYKTDDNGEYYYEKLDGRPVYDKLVLNKTQILTLEGSWLNQYDPFDADGIFLQNTGAALIKNAALIGALYLPYGIGAAVLAGSLATLVAGLGATFAKFLTGSENLTLSNIEGWAKSMNPAEAKTEYSKQHTWTWENGFSLIGDVFPQLLQQRFLFEHAGQLFGRTSPYSTKGAEKLTKLFQLNFDNWAEKKMSEVTSKTSDAFLLAKALTELQTAREYQIALNQEAYMKSYNKIGEVIGKGYMTGITVADTYGEAKNAGASDTEAALLTLGYAAAEYGLLSTGLGEWIMPELRAEGHRFKAISKGLANLRNNTTEAAERAVVNASTEGKLSFIKKAFNEGKKIFNAEYAGNGTKATIAAGLGEGFEETSEEFLADFSKTMFNLSRWLAGDDTRLDAFGYNYETGKFTASDLIDRYSMSFLGGLMGGALANAKINYKESKNLQNMTSQRAMLELIYIVRNGETDKFFKTMDKMDLGLKNLSTLMETDSLGNITFKPGTATDNLDLAIKLAIRELVNIVQQLLTSNGAGMSDQSFLNKLVLSDLRFGVLTKSATAAKYLTEYNSLGAKLALEVDHYNKLNASILDTNNNNKVEDGEKRHSEADTIQQQALNESTARITEIQNQILDLVDGKRSYKFIADSLFEMSSILSGSLAHTNFAFYVKSKLGKNINELSNEELTLYRNEYLEWKKSNGADKVEVMSALYRDIATQLSDVLINQADSYLNPPKELVQFEAVLNSLNQLVTTDKRGKALDDDSILSGLQNTVKHEREILIDQLTRIIAPDRRAEIDALTDPLAKLDLTHAVLRENLDPFVNTLVTRGFLNESTKNLLNKVFEALTDEISDINQSYNNRLVELDELEQTRPLTPEEDIERSQIYVNMTDTNAESNRITALQSQVAALPTSPLMANINLIAILMGLDTIDLGQLMDRVNSIFAESATDISLFEIDNPTGEAIQLALDLLQMYSTALYGARRDSIGLGNFWGYNATLNEVNAKTGNEHPNLAEIDNKVADTFLVEINQLLKRLEYIQSVYNLASLLKLANADKVSARKDVLIYKKYKDIVKGDSALKHWTGFDEFSRHVLNNMSRHEEILSSGNLNLKEEEKEELLKERAEFEMAVYEFFHKNEDKLNDPEAMKAFFNHFNLYTRLKEIFTEKSDYIDDVSLIWWTASRVALPANAFYTMYKNAAGDDLAPLAPLELAIYNNIAHVANAAVFLQFTKAYRKFLRDDYKSKSVDQRKDVLNLVYDNYDSDTLDFLSTNEMADKCLNFLPCVRYAHTVLTEGIPGAGKSAAVLVITNRILQNYYKEVLDNALVVNGIDGIDIVDGKKLTKSELTRKNMGLPDTVKTMNKKELMNTAVVGWSDYKDPDKTIAEIPETAGEINADLEYVSKAKISNTSEYPSIIFIDEVSQFSMFDLDALEKWAAEHGITILTAGDFDLTKFLAQYKAPDGKTYIVTLARDTMPHCPKLGISMRTDNKISSANIEKFQAWKLNPTTKLDLLYYESEEEGIFGTKLTNRYDGSSDPVLPEVLATIELFKKTLKPGLKIGFIYSNPNSAVAKELLTKYLDLITPMPGNSAQGGEALYYICDIHLEDFPLDDSHSAFDIDAYLDALYTGISRSELGNLVILSNSDPAITSTKMDNNIKDTKKLEAYKRYADKYKQRIDKAVPNMDAPARASHLAPSTPTPSTVGGTPSHVWNTGDKITYNGVDYEILRIEGDEYLVTDGTTPLRFKMTDVDASAVATTSAPLHVHKFPKNSIVAYNGGTYKVLETEPDNYKLYNVSTAKEITVPVTDLEASATNGSLPTGYIPDSPYSQEVVNAICADVWPGYYKHEDMPVILVDVEGVNDVWVPFYLTSNGKWHAFYGFEPDSASYLMNMISGNFENDPFGLIAATEARLNTAFTWPFDNLWDGDKHKYLPLATLTAEEINEKIAPGLTPAATDEFRSLFESKLNPTLEVPPVYSGSTEQLLPNTNGGIAPTHEEQLAIMGRLVSTLENEAADSREGVIAARTLLHSFNTFETGIIGVDDDGYPIVNNPLNLPVGTYKDAAGNIVPMMPRIDSVNGLMHLDSIYRPGTKRTLAEYVEILAMVRNIVMHTESKEDICKKIKGRLARYGVSLDSSFNCQFLIKSSPRIAQSNSSEFIGNSMTPYNKGKSELTLFNGSKDTNSQNPHSKTLSVVFGNKDGHLFELPLFALTSPFTLASTIDENGLLIYGDLFYEMNDMLAHDVDLHTISETLQQKFASKREYADILELFKLYDFTEGGAFYLDGSEFETWTPYKDLEYLGPRFVLSRGYYQIEEGLSYNVKDLDSSTWITAQEFANLPNGYMSKNIFVATTGFTKLNLGHAFVLWTLDPDLTNDTAMMRQFLKQQQDPSEPKKVLAMYLLPPKATLNLYFLNIVDIFTGNKTGKHIGDPTTAFKILQVLRENTEFLQLYEQKHQLRKDAWKMLTGILDTIAASGDITGALANKIDLSEYGYGKGPLNTNYILDRLLAETVYSVHQQFNSTTPNSGLTYTPDPAALNLVNSLLNEAGIDGVFYRTVLPYDSPQIEGVPYIPGQNPSDPNMGYMVDGLPYRLHGKIDMVTMRGDIHSIVHTAVLKMRVRLGTGLVRYSDDNKYYLAGTLSTYLQRSPAEKMMAYINRKVTLTDALLTIILQYLESDLATGISKAADFINNLGNGQFAIRIGNQLKINEPRSALQGLVIQILDTANNPIPEVTSTGSDYMFHFKGVNSVTGEEKLYTASFDGHTFVYSEILPPTPPTPPTPPVNNTGLITEERFNEIRTIKSWINDHVNRDPASPLAKLFKRSSDVDVYNLLNASTYDEFNSVIEDWVSDSDADGDLYIGADGNDYFGRTGIIMEIAEALKNDDSPEATLVKLLLQDIANIEARAIAEENGGPVCSINIYS